MPNANWNQLGLDIDGEATGDQFGRSVSLSSDGTVLAIGAKYNDNDAGANAGHVRIYEYSGGSWSQKGADIDGEGDGDSSGRTVSLSSDGSVVAIGAPRNDDAGNDAGHVKIYEYSGSSWSQKGANINGDGAVDGFGKNVSLSSNGNIVAIGAETDKFLKVYEYDSGSWSQKGSDMPGGGDGGGQVGASVSLSSDGSIAAIGDYNDDEAGYNVGHVRVYEYSGSSWSQKGDDIDGEAANDYSGFSVSLSSDGTIVAIGAIYNDGDAGNLNGHVRVYEWNSATSAWDQKGADIDGEANLDLSAWSVSLSDDGLTVAIGAYQNDGTDTNAGHVRVYEYKTITETEYDNGNTDNTTGASGVPIIIDGGVSWGSSAEFWVQRGDDIDGEAANDLSGASVSLSSDGGILAIGAPYNDGAGHVRVYSFPVPAVSAIIQKIITDNPYVNGAAIVHVSPLPNVSKTKLPQNINDNTGIDAISDILSTRFDDTFYYTGDE